MSAGAGVDAQLVAGVAARRRRGRAASSTMVATSVMRGTRRMTQGSSVSRLAAMSLSAEFLAPESTTVALEPAAAAHEQARVVFDRTVHQTVTQYSVCRRGAAGAQRERAGDAAGGSRRA